MDNFQQLLCTEAVVLVNSVGYQIVDRVHADDAFGPYVGERCDDGVFVQPSARRTVAIDDPIVTRFASLKRPDILDFANRFGRLGLPKQTGFPDWSEPQKIPGYDGVWLVEPIHLWMEQVYDVGRVLELWQAATRELDIRSGRLDPGLSGLEELITWEDDSVHTRGRAIAAKKDVVFSRFVKGDLLLPAFWYIQQTINEKLNGNTNAQIIWAEIPFDRVNPDIREMARLSITARTLVGLLWLQLAKMVMGDMRTGRCEQCGEWFWSGKKGARVRGRRFCSSRCRAAFSNEKRRQEGQG